MFQKLYLFAASLEQMYPPGICVTIYPQKNEPWIIPTVSGSQLNFAFYGREIPENNRLQILSVKGETTKNIKKKIYSKFIHVFTHL